MRLHARSFGMGTVHALYQRLSPRHMTRSVTPVAPFYRWETEAGKVKYSALGARVDLHSGQSDSKASLLISEATLPPTHSPPMGIRAVGYGT